MKNLIALLFFVIVVRTVDITVDPTQNHRPISPLIYGINFATSDHTSSSKLPLNRWGGNTKTRYNYVYDVENTGADYYFENIPSCWGSVAGCPPSGDPKEVSAANKFIQFNLDNNITSFFTVNHNFINIFRVKTRIQVPIMGWISKEPKYDHPFDCGCPKTSDNGQSSYDQWDPNCGNGKIGNDMIATCAPPTTTSIAINSTWSYQWATYLKNKFGPSNGRWIFMLDNEPNLWYNTHYDVHPSRTTYDELWVKMRDHAKALIEADPTAQIAAFCEWGWPNYFCSAADLANTYCSSEAPDRKNHGGLDLASWLLQQFKQYEDTNGVQLIHYFDLHYYPQGGTDPLDASITRSLYDKTYKDPSWINENIYLIPRMRDWVSQNYPKLKISIGEYDFYSHDTDLGATVAAEVLGIFGREGLDAATAWGAPDVTEKAWAAYRAYTNFDGNGHGFESTSCLATSSSATTQSYASFGPTGTTVVICNEDSSPVTIDLIVTNFTATGLVVQWTPASSGSTLESTGLIYKTTSDGTLTTLTIPAQKFSLVHLPGVVDSTSSTGGGAVSTTGSTGSSSSGSTTGTVTTGVDATGADESGGFVVAYSVGLIIYTISILV